MQPYKPQEELEEAVPLLLRGAAMALRPTAKALAKKFDDDIFYKFGEIIGKLLKKAASEAAIERREKDGLMKSFLKGIADGARF